LAIIEVVWVTVQIPMVRRSYKEAVIGFIAMTKIYFLYRSSVPEYLNVGSHRHEQEAVRKKMTEKMISPRAQTLFTNQACSSLLL
jgi:hypothetical protein